MQITRSLKLSGGSVRVMFIFVSDTDPLTMSDRQIGKETNLSLIFGEKCVIVCVYQLTTVLSPKLPKQSRGLP